MGARDPQYRIFTGALPDPRTADIAARADALAAVIAVEGPILAARAYRCVVRAAGGKQVTGLVRQLLDEAVEELVTSGRVLMDDPEPHPDAVLRAPDHPPVRRRSRGPRDLDEIPIGEIASHVEDIWSRAPRMAGEMLKRTVLDRLDLVRLTPAVSARLDRAITAAGHPATT